MSVPPKRRPRSSKRRRAAHFALKKIKTIFCPKCKHQKMPHQVCSFCGVYKTHEVLKSKLGKKEEKKLAKQKSRAAEKQR